MTTLAAPSVRDRRQAALDRLGDRGRPAASARSTPDTARRSSLRRLDRRTKAATTNGAAPAAAEPVTREELARPSLTWFGIVAVVAVLTMLGLVMVLSASSATEVNRGHSPYGVFLRQLLWAGTGAIALVVGARIPYRAWRRWWIPLGVVGVVGMLAPFMPHIGSTVNGARAWVRIGGWSVQPSEMLKLVVVIVVAELLTRRSGELNHRTRTLLPLAVIAGIASGLAAIQEDIGSAMVLGAIAFGIAWIAGVPFAALGALATSAAVVALGFILSSPARVGRFTAFLDVEAQKEHLAWQTYQGWVSIANGGVTGSGIGGSRTKFGSLPYAHSDFIFAVIADELGLIGAAVVVVGFLLLVLFGIQTALAAPDRFGMLVAGGISAWFAVQSIVNLGGVVGLLPVTGLTLPFFSSGGSSLFVSMAAVGLLLSVNRRIGSRTVVVTDGSDLSSRRRAAVGSARSRRHGG